MNTSVIFQYILDNTENPKISLKIDGATIDLMKSMTVLEVSKTLGCQKFEISDPNCAQNILKYIYEPEDEAVTLDMNSYFMIISNKQLYDLLKRAGVDKDMEHIEGIIECDLVYEEIWNAAMTYECYTSIGQCDYWVTNACDKEFIEFAHDFVASYEKAHQ